MNDNRDNLFKTITEEIEVAGQNLADEIRRLVAEGNVRRLRIRTESGDMAVELPLTVGAVAGGVVVLASPVLAVLGVLAVFAARLKVEIVRVEDVSSAQEEDRKD